MDDMTNYANSAIATAADYADALLTSRRFKNVLVLILVLMLVAMLAIFFVAEYTNVIVQHAPAASATVDVQVQPATVPVTGPEVVPALTAVEAAAPAPGEPLWRLALQYLVGIINFLGIVLSIVLSFVLLLIVMIMLVGRLIGVARLTSALIWSLIIVLLLFPWQAFLHNAAFEATFKIPGVLYTWSELVRDAGFHEGDSVPQLILKWARYVGFPVLALILLLVVQVKSNRGLRQALGEAEPAVEEPRPEV
jgi:hypothetical protein